MERDFHVLAYDIASDSRRARVARLMESLGDRVQGSVFEAYLTPAELDKLVKRALKILDKEEDSLRVYSICAGCKEKIKMHGISKAAVPPGVKII